MNPMSPNLTSSLVEHLRHAIIEGIIPAGDKLPSEAALIAEHGVSRTVVREAMARLKMEGLVHTRKGSGSFALAPPPSPGADPGPRQARSLEDRRALLAFRTGIEAEAAALAARAHGPRDLEALRLTMDAFSTADASPADAMTHDFRFHLAVATASGNAYFADALTGLGPAMISMPRHRLDADTTGGHRLGDVSAEHGAVVDAIAAGDAMAASAAMRSHLVNSRRRLENEANA